MKFTMLLLLLLSFGTSTFAQSNRHDSLLASVGEYTSQLFRKNRDLQEAIILQYHCLGYGFSQADWRKEHFYQSQCSKGLYTALYLFHYEEGRWIIHRFDPCHAFVPVTQKTETHAYYTTHRDSILASVIQEPDVIVINDSTELIRLPPHHSCYAKLTWLSSGDTLKYVAFGAHDYEQGSTYNSNATENAKLPMIQWFEMVLAEMKLLEKRKRFKPVRSKK